MGYFCIQELVHVSLVLAVARLAQRKVVALLAVESEVVLSDWLQALVTSEPHIVTLILMPLVRLSHGLLL